MKGARVRREKMKEELKKEREGMKEIGETLKVGMERRED